MVLYVGAGRGAPYLTFDTASDSIMPIEIYLSYSQTSPNKLTGTVVLSNGKKLTESNSAINIPSGMCITGFSTMPAAKTANVPLNRLVKIPNGITDIYAVFKTVSNTVTMSLYNSSAEPNVVNKTSYITSAGSLSGTFRGEVSVTNPSITFYFNGVPTFNYVYIQKFSRHYYVTAITNISNNLWRADLKCDVLMSFKSEILNLYCVIARQENAYNDNLIDGELLQENGETVTYETINNTVLNVHDSDAASFVSRNYVLVAVGG